MRRILLITLTLLCPLMLSAQHEIVFTPQWSPQAQFAGFYVAQKKGFYHDAGLNVRIQHPSTSSNNVRRMKEGKSQIITLQLPSALRCINEGLPVINVMQQFQNNSQVIISHTPLKSIKDLKGKKVGCWKAGFSELAYIMNHKYQAGIEWVPYISTINLFISKAIDATLAQSYNEYFQLRLAGQKFTGDQLIYLADIGMNIPEDGVYVTPEYYSQHKSEVDKFVAASRKGWEWAVQHPEETLSIVMEVCQQNNINTNLPAQRWMLQQVIKLMVDKKSGKRTYRLSPDSFQQLANMMFDNGFLKNKITYQQITQP